MDVEKLKKTKPELFDFADFPDEKPVSQQMIADLLKGAPKEVKDRLAKADKAR